MLLALLLHCTTMEWMESCTSVHSAAGLIGWWSGLYCRAEAVSPEAHLASPESPPGSPGWALETIVQLLPFVHGCLSSNATKTSRLGSFASPTLIHGAFSLLKGTNQHILMIGYIDIYKLLKETELINR